MRWPTAVALAAAAIAGTLALSQGARGGEEPFPHDEHVGLFPLCTGCHEGVPEGDLATFYPEPESCAECHDGVEQEEVEWEPPSATEPEPFRFTHPSHQTAVLEAGDEELDCDACHAQAAEQPMVFEGELVLESCLECHAHEAESHFVDADCETCHGPAAETEMGGGWLATLPYPEDHVQGEFLREAHGELAGAEAVRCATCHVQESCTSCHVNAELVPEIAAIPAAREGLELPHFAAHYFIPPSHLATDFLDGHGELASVEACSTCHTRSDCADCHTAELPVVAVALPRAEDVRAPGVFLEPKPPTSHLTPAFVMEHGALAVAGASSCASCHVRNFCADCHEASSVRAEMPPEFAGPLFHPPNYLARHSSDAYGRELECSSCHDTAAFCRDCHDQSGFGTTGRLGQGFHDAEPNWLLRHGLPARQGLESCASCHAQTDCLQCHSTLGAFQISPHGSDFDPQRAYEKNPAICLACHVQSPIQ